MSEEIIFNEGPLHELLNGPQGPVARDLSLRAIRVEAAAKQNASHPPPSVPGSGPAVRTGRLRSSITWQVFADGEGLYADIGSNVEYACVFNAHTVLPTSTGARTIGQVQSGEKVFTQTGEYHQVIARTSFSALEKPELIELSTPWRANRGHKITLTLDHKVLAFRDGRNQWIEAGNLRSDDLVYSRSKVSPARGTRRVKTCSWCEKQHQGQGKRYCSQVCRDAAWAAGANPHLGALRSDATRGKLRDIAIKRGAGAEMNRLLAQRGYITSCERDVETWLKERGVIYERQVVFGDHVVDFFLPIEREIIEADGAYWHQEQERDIERDRELLVHAPGVEITHLHFFNKRFTPPIDPEPLPGVRYVVCNPGPKSFVDPVQFTKVPVTIMRSFVYGAKAPKPKGTLSAQLFDISVEGVHSFVAAGLLISNSYVELGTERMAPRPYLRPALPAAIY